MNQQRIYFLGEPFSFHYLAAQAFFGGDNQFVSAASFDAIIEQTRLNENSFGVMAVENTLAGDVPGNFIRIANSGLTICGSITLPVELFLAAKENISLDQLTTVYSHEMAIKETSTFFHNIRIFNLPQRLLPRVLLNWLLNTIIKTSQQLAIKRQSCFIICK
ncbi:MAG: hypothetical protein IPL12_10255 [Bacteroidetes bacterium]|nr:hypothetical protein [Bacteroidota bacterium]